MRVGLIGCGAWGQFILRDLRKLGCTVTVVLRSTEARNSVARDFDIEVVGSLDDLSDVDGIVVATPTSTHSEVVAEALGRRVPIFCEKPLTCDPVAAARLSTLGQGRLFVMDKWRYHDGVLKLAEIARSGRLGEILGVKTRRLGWGGSHYDVDVAWVLLPHDLSIALEILGEIPEITAAVGEIVNGRLCGLTALGVGRTWHLSEVGERSTVNQRRIELHGTEGTAVLEDSYSDAIMISGNPALSRPAPPPSVERVPIATTMPLLAELSIFVDHLRGGPPPKSSAKEGAAIVAAIACARRLAGIAEESRK